MRALNHTNQAAVKMMSNIFGIVQTIEPQYMRVKGGMPMASWLITLIAFVSTGLCIFLWFRDVRRVMRERKSTVESAGGQLAACWNRARKTHDDPECAAICERSKDIYRQALTLYNQTMHKPFNFLPAYLMGFRIKSENTFEVLYDNGSTSIVLPGRDDNRL